MVCRSGCGACCVAISISSPIPGMPSGKPAGIPCVNLKGGLCAIFHSTDRPKVCGSLQVSPETCGTNTRTAYYQIASMERRTAPKINL